MPRYILVSPLRYTGAQPPRRSRAPVAQPVSGESPLSRCLFGCLCELLGIVSSDRRVTYPGPRQIHRSPCREHVARGAGGVCGDAELESFRVSCCVPPFFPPIVWSPIHGTFNQPSCLGRRASSFVFRAPNRALERLGLDPSPGQRGHFPGRPRPIYGEPRRDEPAT